MPQNPSRSSQGGDVEGETPTDTTWAVGKPIEVSKASFDPGYDTQLSRPDTTEADLRAGYCEYGRSIGEPGSPSLPKHDSGSRSMHGDAPGGVGDSGPRLKGK